MLLSAVVGAGASASGSVGSSSAALKGTCVTLRNNAGGAQYTFKMGIGTPYQYINCIGDTGSYNLLVDSSYCNSTSCKGSHHRLVVENSTSFVDEKVENDLRYGQGAVGGRAARDRVKMGKLEAMLDMTLMTDTDHFKHYDKAYYDGVCGLGRRNDTASSVVHQTAPLTALGVNHFTMCLGPASINGKETGQGGRLDLNQAPPFGEFEDLPMVGAVTWAVQLGALSIAGHNGTIPMTGHCDSPGVEMYGGVPIKQVRVHCAAIIDSGTTLLALPKATHKALLDTIEMGCPLNDCLLNLQKIEKCEGEHFEALPAVNLLLGGKNLSLSPSVYMGEMSVNRPMVKKLGDSPFAVEYMQPGVACIPLFMGQDSNTNIGPLVILGMPFLRQYQTRFSRPIDGVENVSMAIARVPTGSTDCNQCSAGEADEAELPVAESALQPERLREEGGQPEAVPMDVEQLRLPWYAVPPDMVPEEHRQTVAASARGVMGLAAVDVDGTEVTTGWQRGDDGAWVLHL